MNNFTYNLVNMLILSGVDEQTALDVSYGVKEPELASGEVGSIKVGSVVFECSWKGFPSSKYYKFSSRKYNKSELIA